MVNYFPLTLILIATFIGSFGPIFLKKASDRLTRDSFQGLGNLLRSTIGNKFLVFGLGFYGTSFILYMFALHGNELSVIYPLVSLSYVWVCLLSVAMLHERMTMQKWIAIFLIILGATMVGLGS